MTNDFLCVLRQWECAPLLKPLLREDTDKRDALRTACIFNTISAGIVTATVADVKEKGRRAHAYVRTRDTRPTANACVRALSPTPYKRAGS